MEAKTMMLKAASVVLMVITLTDLADGRKPITETETKNDFTDDHGHALSGSAGIKAFVNRRGHIRVYREKEKGNKTGEITISFSKLGGNNIGKASFTISDVK